MPPPMYAMAAASVAAAPMAKISVCVVSRFAARACQNSGQRRRCRDMIPPVELEGRKENSRNDPRPDAIHHIARRQPAFPLIAHRVPP